MAETNEERLVIWVRGIPWSKNEQEVAEWFLGKNVTVHDGCFGVYFAYQSTGIPRGDCYMRLESARDVDEAVKLNSCPFGERYVEVNRSSWSVMKASLGDFCRGPEDAVIRMRGLPFSTREDEIRQFFKGYGVSMVLLCPNEHGRPSGDAFVRFENKSEAKRSFAMHRQMLGERYIELFLASEAIVEEFEKNKFIPTQPGIYERTFTASRRTSSSCGGSRRSSIGAYSLPQSPLLAGYQRQVPSPFGVHSSGLARPNLNIPVCQPPLSCLSPTIFPPGFGAVNGMSPQPPPQQASPNLLPAGQHFLRGSPNAFAPGPALFSPSQITAPCQWITSEASNPPAAWTDFIMNNDAAMQRYMQLYTESYNATMQQATNIVAEQMQQQFQQQQPQPGNGAGAFGDQQQQPITYYNGASPNIVNGGIPMPLTPQTIMMPPPPSPGMPMSPFFHLPSPMNGGPATMLFPVSPFVLMPPFTPNGATMQPSFNFFPTVNNGGPASVPQPPPPPASTAMHFSPPQNVGWTPSA